MMGYWDGSGISWNICKQSKQSAPHSRQITTPTPHHSIFTGQMLFLMPNQQRQSTEDNSSRLMKTNYMHNYCSVIERNWCTDQTHAQVLSRLYMMQTENGVKRQRVSKQARTEGVYDKAERHPCTMSQHSQLKAPDTTLPASTNTQQQVAVTLQSS